MSDIFSTPASHAFDHPEVGSSTESAEAGPSSMGDAVRDLSIEEAFEVEDTVRLVLEGGFKTIGLQFPDELLPSSVVVFKAIQRRVGDSGAQAYVLADSTYGSCCPDVLSCLHLPADLLVHYGHACLTQTEALPVHYVFPRQRLDVFAAAQSFRQASQASLNGDEIDEASGGKGVIVVWDVAFDWLAEDIVKTFTEVAGTPISFATIQRPALRPTHQVTGAHTETGAGKAPSLRSIEPPPGVDLQDCMIWYIGEEGRSLVNLQMTHAANQLFAYLPSSDKVSALHSTTSKLLSRRLYAVHQAMASDVFGLIVGNVGLASSRPLLEQLRRALKRHRKKSYTLSVGRLNPAKLANFETIECFVLVGCAEGGVVDSKDFYRPIITPWELLLALQGPEGEWDPAKWKLDISAVLKDAQAQDEPNDTGDALRDDTPQFSLISGTLRTPRTFGNGNGTADETAESVQALTLRNKESTVAKIESAGSIYLSSRHFQGLEPRVGQDEPAQLEEGRSGMARGYEEEH